MARDREEIAFESLQRMYWYGTRSEKKRLLDNLCHELGIHRKSLIRRLNRIKMPRKPGPGRPSGYSVEIHLPPLKAIWLAMDQPCGKRLKQALPLWLPYYENKINELEDSVRNQLLKMSPATIDRILKFVKLKHKKKGLGGTRPGTLLKTQIPIKTEHWDVSQPGFMEADTVAHCGNSVAGDFVWSITLTDIASHWTEIRAVWNKGATGVVAEIKEIEAILPFILKGFDCDNGAEFLNYHLLHYFTDRANVVQFTRSRPYRKNDNAHVEQKNWTHVRQLFGYDRFEDKRLVGLMNDLYRNEWSLLQNYFVPTMKLKTKMKENSKYKKTYFTPCTPYERLLLSEAISDEKKNELREKFKTLNPFYLKERIEKKLKIIFQYVKITQNVRHRI